MKCEQGETGRKTRVYCKQRDVRADQRQLKDAPRTQLILRMLSGGLRSQTIGLVWSDLGVM